MSYMWKLYLLSRLNYLRVLFVLSLTWNRRCVAGDQWLLLLLGSLQTLLWRCQIFDKSTRWRLSSSVRSTFPANLSECPWCLVRIREDYGDIRPIRDERLALERDVMDFITRVSEQQVASTLCRHSPTWAASWGSYIYCHFGESYPETPDAENTRGRLGNWTISADIWL